MKYFLTSQISVASNSYGINITADLLETLKNLWDKQLSRFYFDSQQLYYSVKLKIFTAVSTLAAEISKNSEGDRPLKKNQVFLCIFWKKE